MTHPLTLRTAAARDANAAAAPAATAPSRPTVRPAAADRTARLAALGGIGFAAGLVVQNGVLLAGAPEPGAALAEVARFYEASALRVNAAIAIAVVNLAFLFLFVNGIAHHLRSTPGEPWGRLAAISVSVVASLFFTVVALQSYLSARAPDLAAAELGLAWDLHTAVLAAATPALGVTVGALALGLRHAAVPRWISWVGCASAVLVPVGGFAAPAMIDGSPVLFVMMAGFALWIVFLAAAGVSMLRVDRAARGGPLGEAAA